VGRAASLQPAAGSGSRATPRLAASIRTSVRCCHQDEPRGRPERRYAVAIQRDGRILVSGQAADAVLLARYEANGRLDPTFGKRGLVIADFGHGPDIGHALAVQADGRIVVAGQAADAILLARYEPDGTPDWDSAVAAERSPMQRLATTWDAASSSRPTGDRRGRRDRHGVVTNHMNPRGADSPCCRTRPVERSIGHSGTAAWRRLPLVTERGSLTP
jgi:uncharacterized delta-60 repeat protein